MILEIIGYAFVVLVAITFAWLALCAYVVKRMSEAFEMGQKMERLRHQLGQEAHDALLVGAGINPTDLPGRSA